MNINPQYTTCNHNDSDSGVCHCRFSLKQVRERRKQKKTNNK